MSVCGWNEIKRERAEAGAGAAAAKHSTDRVDFASFPYNIMYANIVCISVHMVILCEG